MLKSNDIIEGPKETNTFKFPDQNKYKKILLEVFDQLEYLEKTNDLNKSIDIPKIISLSDAYHSLEMIEKNKIILQNKIIPQNINDILEEIETEFDEILLPNDDDLFGKDEIEIKIAKNNVTIIDSFPNLLLLEESFQKQPNSDINQKKIDQETTNKENIEQTELETKQEDIWDILNEMKKETNSESLDDLATDSDKTDKICKKCGAVDSIIEDPTMGIMVCSNCGLVNEELLDHNPEWRHYNNDDNRGEGVNRCGCPSNYFFPKSSQGTIMTGSNRNRLKRKQKWNSMVYKERSLNDVFKFISEICEKNKISKIIEDSAKIMYKKLSDCKYKKGKNAGKQIIIRGNNRISIIAACIFKACEMNKTPRTNDEIAKMFGIGEKRITKGKKQFNKIIKNCDDQYLLDQFKPCLPEDYIRRHCPKLKINKENTELAVSIARNSCRMKLASDHNTISIAAGAILLMVEHCNLNIDKKDISKLFGTSDVTVVKIFNKIVPYVQALVDDDATDHLIKKFKLNG